MSDCTCLCCEKQMSNVLDSFSAGAALKDGYQPVGGLAFNTHGHFGSAYFDPMDESYLEICICDECLESAEKAGRVFRSKGREPGMKDVPDDIRENATNLARKVLFEASAPVTVEQLLITSNAIAIALMAERERCADLVFDIDGGRERGHFLAHVILWGHRPRD